MLSCLETPPRVWGRRDRRIELNLIPGNTPTGVGKTVLAVVRDHIRGKHPHGRGEDEAHILVLPDLLETPPRAWGRPGGSILEYPRYGNTPTGVGKTTLPVCPDRKRQKHPHGCGEDATSAMLDELAQETPPRVWGRLAEAERQAAHGGNTPTGVGKTVCAKQMRPCAKKHPHGCGEDLLRPAKRARLQETPPRVWGRLTDHHLTKIAVRNTPTGVGKTLLHCPVRRFYRKHPHGCGEDSS